MGLIALWLASSPAAASSDGVTITRRGAQVSVEGDALALETVTLNGGALGVPQPVGQSLVFRGVTEWWQPTPTGLEQGWIVYDARADVAIEVRVSGTVHAVDAEGAWLVGDDGGWWRYDKALAWDADRRPVPVSIRPGPQPDTLRVVAECEGATFPVTIDPTLTRVATMRAPDGTEGFNGLGRGLGDMDGDGCDDFAVHSSGPAHTPGAAYVLFGGPEPGTRWQRIALSQTEGVGFGYLVVSGDVDGDGDLDLVFAGRGNLLNEVYVMDGWDPAGAEVASLIDNTVFVGGDIDAADIDGDGIDEVLISRGPNAFVLWEDPLSNPAWGLFGDFCDESGCFGVQQTTGDFNADGYADVASAARGQDLLVVYGAPTGLGDTPTRLYGVDGNGLHTVETTGDLDDDGFDALLICMNSTEVWGQDWYGAVLHWGSAEGFDDGGWLQMPPDGFRNCGMYGDALPGGDVDGDGVDDLIVNWDSASWLYFGSVEGPHLIEQVFQPREKLPPVGDVNGDGYADATVKLPDEQMALLYGGCRDVDHDDVCVDEDCDDQTASTYPGATELLNQVDDDCDGQVDEGLDAPDSDAPGDSDQPDPGGRTEPPCSCASPSLGIGVSLAVLALAAIRRRRQPERSAKASA